MMYSIILQSQSGAIGVFENTLLIVGVGVLCGIATYFYSRNKYQKVISALKKELQESRKQSQNYVNRLEEVNKDLFLNNERLDLMEEEYMHLENENRKLRKIYDASKTLVLNETQDSEPVTKDHSEGIS